MSAPSFRPEARGTDLIIQELQDETLVLDLESHRAHCLNRMAALIWRDCDGKRTVEQLAALLRERLGDEATAEENAPLVLLAIERLGRAGLFVEPLPDHRPATPRPSRRELAGAALVLPIVLSVIAPSAAEATSGCRDIGTPCTLTPQCCGSMGNPASRCCTGGMCGPIISC